MKARLKQIIEYKTKGRQKDFAEIMGWTTQYLNRLLKDGSIGLTPIAAILEKYPEIDSRWLILGEGEMLTKQVNMVEYTTALIELERYIPVMDEEDIKQLAEGFVKFPEEQIAEWKKKLEEKEAYKNNIIVRAYARQAEMHK